ncbi:major intrinsically disordered Notch2-binding receptor 1 [Dunckerocampus dactyliophorus]|uniref:major intrinsically disordered Notch2-binding receptor 1 n=1 Tax=Dunckerocampus dactyliophorus TaxID=161453 RepID=UPI0024067680|nr:major intrinsically disordered Notch2-binding receptor 1 [Dunckerocampus dactyliophorus]
MEAGPEQFLRRILEDLDVQHANMSDQELCKSLCTRMDLVHLAKLRAHLYRAASLDPDFPTTLFRDKMRGPAEDEQSKRRVLAADIVAMLHLVHAHGGVAAHRVQRHEHAETRRVRHRYAPLGQPPSPLLNNPPCPEPRRTFLPASEPNFLLGVGGRQGGCRASSLDKLHHLPQYSPSPPCRRVHEGPPMARTCLQKRNIFKEDFHKMASFGPQVVTAKDGEGAEPYRHTPAPFFNRSFEVAYRKPYCPPPLSPALPERRRVKHESLDDLQASTYFGPTTVSECVSGRKQSSQGRKQGAWPVKSLSLNVEEGPHDLERSFAGKPNFHRNASVVGADENRFQSPKRPVAYPGGLANDGVKTKEGALMDRVESAKRMWDKHVNGPSFHGTDGSACIGTQTEHGGQKTASRAFKHSDEESEIVGDDISDIFRFLDEMSVCDSLGMVQSSCYDSAASLKSEGDSSPERNTVKLAKSQLDRLLRSLDNTDDELKSSVSKLVARIGEIERKLESLSGVRGEISQVLSKLNKLDQKIQEPDATPASSPPDASPHVLRCHTLNVGGVRDDSPGLRATALRKNVFTRRSSHSLDDDDAESKVVEVSPRDWRTLSYSCHPDAVDKERACRAKEVDQYDFPGVLRPPKAARESYLTEHHLRPAAPPHAKGSPLYSGPRLSGPSWTADEYKRNSGNTLDRQAESLSPNKLEFWMEDVYTPGYDSLLKQREAAFRRAKACKIAALIAATFSVILVIVVPICAMKT